MNDKKTNQPDFDAHLAQLNHKDASQRVKAAETISSLPACTPEIVSTLEKMAAKDRSKLVKEAALKALLSPACRKVQQSSNARIAFSIRRLIVSQIGQWEQEGLITPEQGKLLSQRYNFDFTQSAAAPSKSAKPKAPQPKRSLMEIMLSDTSIKVILYLGSLFVIGFAYLIASVIESVFFQFVLLFLLTAGFLGASMLLFKRLNQASIVLFIVFSLLLPINASVIQDSIHLKDSFSHPYWIVVTLILTVCWGVGTFFYNSRLLSMLAFLGISQVFWQIGDWINLSQHLTLFLWQLVLIGLLGVIRVLISWKDKNFTRPAFNFHQLMQATLLLNSLAHLGEMHKDGWWALAALTWLAAAGVFLFSSRLYPNALYPFVITAVLLPVPSFFLNTLNPDAVIIWAFNWIWGTAFLFRAEFSADSEKEERKPFALPFYLSALFLHPTSIFFGNIENDILGFGLLAATTAVYGYLTFSKSREVTWAITLFAGILTYFKLYHIPPLEDYDIYEGFAVLWPAMALLAGEIYTRRKEKAKLWGRWLLIGGAGLAGLAGLTLFFSGFGEPLRAAIGFLILAVFMLGYASSYPLAWIGYTSTASLALGLLFTLIHTEQDTWLAPFLLLSLAYFIPGHLFLFLKKSNPWVKMLRTSGLILALLTAFSSPLQGGPAAIVTLALAAVMFTLEAYRQNNINLAVPADLLYIGAYFMVLSELKVDQPQFYSVGAALLGMIMHYLLVKRESGLGAFIAGMISQLVLLSTTYIQIISTGEGFYFFMLIFQALVVIGYGLVVHSRSLLFTPIGFIVIAVLTVVFNALDPDLIILFLCCGGFLFLILGIIAALMRDKLLSTRDKLKEKITRWQG